jgi:trehalose utilization protein
MSKPLRITVWHEYRHEKTSKTVAKVYPDGMHMVMKSALEEHLGKDAIVRTATLDEPEHGLTDEVLANTDVLTWWGHCAHGDVKDEIAQKVAQRVREGMGLIVLHSGHYSKPFKLLMGTNCHLKWREAGEKERLWAIIPGHPITAGMSTDFIELEHTEMYGEHFDIPDPDELVFISWFEGGEVFRSGCVWRRGAGKVFYFRPGHETFPIYYHNDVRRVLANGARYVAPPAGVGPLNLGWQGSPGDVVKPLVKDGVVPYREGSPCIKVPLETIKSDHKADQSLHEHQATH